MLIENLYLNQTLLTILNLESQTLLALCETNLGDSINSGNFSVRVYLPLTRKDSSTHMHGLTDYVKEGLPFGWDLSLKKLSRFLLMFWTGFTSLRVLLLFPLLIKFFVFLQVFLFYFN